MIRRKRLILTKPSDVSFEAYVSFRQNTTIVSMHSQKELIKDDLVDEWEKFWVKINSKPQKRFTIGNSLEYFN